MGRKRYTDEFRASAVLMLEAAGYTGETETSKTGALTAVSNKLDVPHSTLRRWFIKQQNPPPSDLVRDKKIQLTDILENEMRAALGEMEEARSEATYRELATSFGIMFDKYQLLRGGPTANVANKIQVEYVRDWRTAQD